MTKHPKKEDVKEEGRVKRAKDERRVKDSATCVPKKEESVDRSRSSGTSPVESNEREGRRVVEKGHTGMVPSHEGTETGKKVSRYVPGNENHTYNVPMDVGAVAHWVNWSFDAGRQFQAQKTNEDMIRHRNAENAAMSNCSASVGNRAYHDGNGMDYNIRPHEQASLLYTNPPGLVPMTSSKGMKGKTGTGICSNKGRTVLGPKAKGGKDSLTSVGGKKPLRKWERHQVV